MVKGSVLANVQSALQILNFLAVPEGSVLAYEQLTLQILKFLWRTEGSDLVNVFFPAVKGILGGILGVSVHKSIHKQSGLTVKVGLWPEVCGLSIRVRITT